MVDNTVLAAAISSGRCRHQPTQAVVRDIFRLAVTHSLTLVPSWIPSAENDLADALSRFDVPYITSFYPSVLSMVDLDPSFLLPAVPHLDDALHTSPAEPDPVPQSLPIDFADLLLDDITRQPLLD
jgi:hypothetical protein